MSMDPIIGAGNGPQAAGSELVKDVTAATFARDVLDASMTVPVIVDFWAPWCGPCKQLGPMIEKAVTAAGGAVRLVKIDIDQNPEIAQQMQIQSIPAVYAFFQGRPVDGFVGALPESQIKDFIKKLAAHAGGDAGPSGLDDVLDQAAQALEAGDVATASALYAQVLQADPGNVAAAAGLSKCAIQAGDHAQAQALIDQLPEEAQNDAAVVSVKAALELAAQATEAAGETAALQAALDANPEDKQARFDLAVAQFGAGDAESACENLLWIVAKDREWNDESARKQLLKVFEALGPTHETTLSARRQLSSILFS